METFIDILTSYKEDIENIMVVLDVMADSRPTTLLTGHLPIFDECSATIKLSMTDLYDNREIPDSYGVNMNFNILNAYADSAKEFGEYIQSADKFIPKPDFYNIRGEFYDIVKPVTDGQYIKNMEWHINNVLSESWRMEELYIEFQNTYVPPLPPAEPVSALTAFWNIHFAEYSEFVNEQFAPFSTLKSDFAKLSTFIYEYIHLYEDTSSDFAIGERFVSAKDVHTFSNKTLKQIYADTGKKRIATYSTDVSKIYGIYEESIALRDSSKLDETDEYDVLLRAVLKSELCKSRNFFGRSAEMFNEIRNFRKEYDI